MAKVDTIQTSFVGGEFAPSLFGRTDVAQYQNAVATLENFIIRPSGSIITCPGTEFVCECKTGGSTSIARLLQFIFSRTDAYIIEMGVGYFRFFTNGAVVVSSGTTPYEVAHTYTAAQIPDIQYCQINDVIYLTHASHPVRTLTRVASNSWTLTDVTFTGGPFMPDNITATTISASSTAGTVTLSASSAIFTPSGATTGHVNTFWRIGGLVTNSTTGLQEQGYVKITTITNTSTATATVMSNLSTSAATTDWSEGSWSSVRGYPARVTFHQQRLAFARTDSEPQTVWASKNFEYTNFAVDSGADDDALNLQLASNESNDIKWLASGRGLVAGTYGGEFTIESGNADPLTPTNSNARKQTSWGSEPIIPRKIGNYFYYIQRFGKKIRELFYFWDMDSYKSIDKTILSSHITEDGITDVSFQQNPDTILWCVTTNGTLATMTREVDQEIQGWAKQTTDGSYEYIATIPSQDGPYDEVWVVVKRTINGASRRYIERFKAIDVPDRQDKCWYVHSGLDYDAFTANTTATISLSATNGSIVITSSTAYFSASSVGKRIRTIDADGVTTGEMKITSYTSSTVVGGTVSYTFSTTSYSPSYWGVSVKTVSGFSHLEGKSLHVLADGGTSNPDQTVVSGSVTLPYDAFVVIGGLPYTQKIVTLPQEAGSQRGTSQGKKQRISEVGLKVNRSYKGFYIGGSSSMLDKINFRDPTTLLGTPELLYTGTIPNNSFRDDYRYGSVVYLYNYDPLPIELLNIITTVDTIDKV